MPASSSSEIQKNNGREQQEAIKNEVYKCPVNKALKDHTGEFEKKIYKVTDGVHVAVGYALANSILVVTPDGVINRYCISPFERWLSNEHLVSNKCRVKRGHYDHRC